MLNRVSRGKLTGSRNCDTILIQIGTNHLSTYRGGVDIKLYHDSVLPLYYQLAEIIRKQIADGSLRVGDKLPSERDLAEMYQVSRNTTRQAVKTLVRDGVLCQEQGRGTFVAKPHVRLGLLRLTSFSEDMLERGLIPGARLLGLTIVEAPAKIGSALQIEPGSKVIKIDRLRLADGEPMAINTSHIPYDLCPDLLDESLDQTSLYRVLEDKYGFRLTHANQGLRAVAASREEAILLNITEGAPLLLQEGVAFLDDDRPLEYLKALYRGDRYEFSINPVRFLVGQMYPERLIQKLLASG